jgi:hypothetical protein
MTKVRLADFCYARSGDKGDGSNVGIFATNLEDYRFLVKTLTAERVKRHFHAICKGEVTRYEAEGLLALNFILHDSLGGGGSESQKTDAQGKAHGVALLEMEVER